MVSTRLWNFRVHRNEFDFSLEPKALWPRVASASFKKMKRFYDFDQDKQWFWSFDRSLRFLRATGIPALFILFSYLSIPLIHTFSP